MKEKIYIYDTTLRDGAQTSVINLTVQNKHEIALMLDQIGVDYIEGGWPGSNVIDNEFFANLPELKFSEFSAFGMTRKAKTAIQADKVLEKVINSDVSKICIVGKSWDFHLKNALNISAEENISMIESSIKTIVSCKKEALFDAEHFFDGYKHNPKFAIDVVQSAFNAGARWVVLCDTNGGTLPHEIYQIVLEVAKVIPQENISIHCHNDTGNAVANSLAAVRAGARQVQGTINGIGERCGNANLISLIPTLSLKMGFEINVDLKKLKLISNFLDNLLEKETNKFAPYIGEYAFAHKGGLHVSAVNKNPKSYEHIEPSLVGNSRKILVSNQAGRSNIISKLKEIKFESENISHESINLLVEEVKNKEAQGYVYYDADASFEILVQKTLGLSKEFFQIYKYNINHLLSFQDGNRQDISQAFVELIINGKIVKSKAEGNGPVNAFNIALKQGLIKQFPILEKIKLKDYRVKIIDPSNGTKATTRVSITTEDQNGNLIKTVGVSQNILDSSSEALCEAITFVLSQNKH